MRAATYAAHFATIPGWPGDTDPGPWYDGKWDTSNDKLSTTTNTDYVDWYKKRLTAELHDLRSYMFWDRLKREQEIMAQADDFSAYWGNLLVSSPSVRPNVWMLILAGVQIGGMVSAYHKSNYRRPRPAQIWPALAPTIYTPGHPAYPSGHATQVHLIANFMDLIAPELAVPARRLAHRIATNREIAGVHYRSDSAAGEWSAPRIVDVMTASGTGSSRVLKAPFQALLESARAEWRETALTTPASTGVPGAPLHILGTICGNDLIDDKPIPAATNGQQGGVAKGPARVSNRQDE